MLRNFRENTQNSNARQINDFLMSRNKALPEYGSKKWPKNMLKSARILSRYIAGCFVTLATLILTSTKIGCAAFKTLEKFPSEAYCRFADCA